MVSKKSPPSFFFNSPFYLNCHSGNLLLILKHRAFPASNKYQVCAHQRLVHAGDRVFQNPKERSIPPSWVFFFSLRYSEMPQTMAGVTSTSQAYVTSPRFEFCSYKAKERLCGAYHRQDFIGKKNRKLWSALDGHHANYFLTYNVAGIKFVFICLQASNTVVGKLLKIKYQITYLNHGQS